MKRTGRVMATAGMTAILLGLTACAPAGVSSDPTLSSPTSSPTSSPSPSTQWSSAPSAPPSAAPTLAPVVNPSAVIVDGDSVSVKASGGGIFLDIPFTTDPMTAVAQLNGALGIDGAISTLPSGGCFQERQQASWGGLSFIWGDDWQRAPGATFLASASGPDTTNGIKVTIPSGHWIGWATADVLSGNASAPKVDYGEWIVLHYDVISGVDGANPDTYYGASALIRNGMLTGFSSPVMYNYDC